MRKGSLSWLYTAWLIIISFAINDVKSAITTAAPTTLASTPAASTTLASTTAASTTLASTTAASTTLASTTAAPTTLASTTAAPTTLASTTAASTTLAATTPTTILAPSSGANITEVRALDSTSLQVRWESVPSTNGPITNYTVCYSLNSPVVCSNDNQKTVDNDTLSTSITGLNVFTKYYVAVKASTVAGAGPLGGKVEGTTGQAAPSSGARITATTGFNSTSLQVTWETVLSTNGPITNYTVCYSLNTPVNCSNNKIVDNDTLSTNITGLNVFTKYFVAVKASTAAGAGPLGDEMEGITGEAAPEKGPNITTINATNSTSINVTWAKVPAEAANGHITHYFICYEVQTSPADICSVRKRVDGVNIRSTVLDNLNEYTTYDVAIQAANSINSGPPGAVKSATTSQDKPARGPNIANITPSSNTLQVTWEKLGVDDANGDITIYEVCYQLGSTDPDCTLSKNVTGVDNTTDLTGLKPATMYTLAVRAFTVIGGGPSGESKSAKTSESAPTKGANVTMVNPINSTALEIIWEKLQGNGTNGIITGYRICYETQQLIPVSCTNHAAVVGMNNTSFNLTGLNEATIYYVAVQARTRAGFGPNGNILNGKTSEAKPAGGPNITSISATSSMSLRVEWKELSRDDANGLITNYRVCYKAKKDFVDICDQQEIVANVRSTTLFGLDKYTFYVVAVQAATSNGYGPLGANMTERTREDIPGVPTIESANASLTAISLEWSPPSKPYGMITNYKVCWRPKDGSSPCKLTPATPPFPHMIVNLRPGTMYNVSVLAITKVGEGSTASVQRNTDRSALDGEVKPDANVVVSDPKTQIGFTLPSINAGERGKIQRFYVIVKRWDTKDNKSNFRETPQSDLKHFNKSANGIKAYIAITKGLYENNMPIIVGNNRKTTTPARRKRRNVAEYLNAPLIKDTQYAIFIRVFYSKDTTSFQSSDILVKKTLPAPTDESSGDTLLIVIVVIVVIVFILVAIFGVLLFRRRKPERNYDGINLETTAKPVVRYPIAIAEFRAHCERLGMNTGLGYQEEYESVRPKGQVSTEIAKRQENVDKNRYNNIHAYDDTRVVLSQLDGEEGSDYINANHIDGFERKNQFIAAQGTLKNTIVDFWRMIWEQKVSSIVMLANPIEKGREKLAVYWPQDRAVKHGPFMIKLDGEVELADYVIRKMTVTQDDIKETRQLTQFHYTVWPDHGVPLYTTSLQAFLTRIRKIVKDDSNPLVVHCSAGVGRTGTFIGIFAMLDMIESTQTVDIFNFVCQMRAQRTHMVQVESQYVFLHKAVLEAIECGDTEINAPDLRVKMIKLNRADPDNPDDIMMGTQFKVLEKYTFVKSNTEEGKKSFNVDKNRNKDILPYEDTRVSLLKSPGVDGSDYINASSIDSYQVRGMYIATQFPLENTVNEFWRMMWEKKSNCIVMLANDDENPDLFKKYWTDKSNDAMLCGNLLVTLDNEEKNEEFVIRNFKLKKNEGGETRDIWHFNYLSWTEDQVPKTTEGIRQMIGKIQDVQRQGGNNPIVVHCSDGSGRTGAFCALVTSLERVKQDQSFNLFQTIMLQRIQRPRMVASVEQYKFCFQAILDFLDSFDQYANFQDLRQ